MPAAICVPDPVMSTSIWILRHQKSAQSHIAHENRNDTREVVRLLSRLKPISHMEVLRAFCTAAFVYSVPCHAHVFSNSPEYNTSGSPVRLTPS